MDKSVFPVVKQVSILSFLCIIFSCSPKEEQKESKAVPVSVQTIQYDSSSFPQEYIGTVESENSVDVSFLIVGNIEQMYVSEGAQVSKGQLLARLNTTSLKSTHDVTVATLRQAEDAYKRMTAMYENKSLPEIQYIDVKTKLEQARSSEAIARKSLQDCNIYAPQSGVIGKRYLEPGANVMPGTPVYNIMDISRVKIKTAIPEGEISRITNGSKCQIKISALNNETFEGHVIEKGISANPVSHTYDIKIQISNAAGKIMPGMVCRVYLNNAGNAERIVIPIKSVQVDYSGKRFVWLKDNQNKAIYKEVILGNLSENGVLVTSGLQAGDELIIAGYQNISTGTLVNVKK
ncbi:Efflux pump periplasmic linker BepF [Sphingobacterium multivorum]|uniref:efflux RND transporter periplasmic adaptor subunit n=1 Tax=Sphingobacterium multivorum TaxID=28454 RepID=UPI000DFE002B|nr:efflux RND transporter periplasmic adaptor subunit [Sphingobacterium multivorum]QQT46637.1 efflux RND transporter periplasmic adaptor subunit [Sphingobacterium multivorum]SUJ89311.1 Efflux pump periplasmic linker BepF [Sphingobacterium multivorum]